DGSKNSSVTATRAAASASAGRSRDGRASASSAPARRRARRSLANSGPGSRRKSVRKRSSIVSLLSIPGRTQLREAALQARADVRFPQPHQLRDRAVREARAVLERDDLAVLRRQPPEQTGEALGVRAARAQLLGGRAPGDARRRRAR